MKGFRLWVSLMGICAMALLLVAGGNQALAQRGSQLDEQMDFVYPEQGKGIRNPFHPLFVPTSTPEPTATPTPTPPPSTGGAAAKATPTPTPIPIPDFELIGIFWDAKRPLAIINNQLLVTGDSVSGALISKIEKDAVYLRYLGRVIKLEQVVKDSISIK